MHAFACKRAVVVAVAVVAVVASVARERRPGWVACWRCTGKTNLRAKWNLNSLHRHHRAAVASAAVGAVVGAVVCAVVVAGVWN